MALILSAASGNFNAGATWVGGIVPGVGDEARASTTHTVTITANVTCTELSNAGTGLFILNSGVTLTANVTHKSATANVNCLQFTAASPATASIVGNITGASAASATTVFGAVINTSSGTLSITGNCTSGSSLNSNAVTNNSSGTTTITGNCLGANSNAIFNASSGTVTIIGNCTGGTTLSGICVYNGGPGTTGPVNITGTVTGGSNATAYGVGNFGSGAVTINGSVLASTGIGVLNNSTGSVAINGNITAAAATGVSNASTGSVTITGIVTAAAAAGMTNSSTGSVTITGNVLAAAATGVNNSSTGPVTITGNITASTAAGVTNSSTATLTISGGTYTASNSANAVSSTNASSVVRASGSFIYASNGFVPINTPKFILLTTPTLAKTRYALNGSTTYVDMFTADNSLGQAAITDVRFGTVYASGALTGVAYIPAAGSVALGVPVDNTTGTATLTAANVRAALGMASANLDTQLAAIPTAVTNANAVWDELMSNHTTAGTYGGRVVRSTTANNELQLNAQNHAAANVHQFQAAVIESVAFATSAVTLFTGAMRTELTPELTEITEVHAIHGLDIANALTVTPTSRTSGAITQAITGDGTTNTVVTRV